MKTIREYEKQITIAYLAGDNKGAHRLEAELYNLYPKHAIGDVPDREGYEDED